MIHRYKEFKLLEYMNSPEFEEILISSNSDQEALNKLFLNERRIGTEDLAGGADYSGLTGAIKKLWRKITKFPEKKLKGLSTEYEEILKDAVEDSKKFQEEEGEMLQKIKKLNAQFDGDDIINLIEDEEKIKNIKDLETKINSSELDSELLEIKDKLTNDKYEFLKESITFKLFERGTRIKNNNSEINKDDSTKLNNKSNDLSNNKKDEKKLDENEKILLREELKILLYNKVFNILKIEKYEGDDKEEQLKDDIEKAVNKIKIARNQSIDSGYGRYDDHDSTKKQHGPDPYKINNVFTKAKRIIEKVGDKENGQSDGKDLESYWRKLVNEIKSKYKEYFTDSQMEIEDTKHIGKHVEKMDKKEKLERELNYAKSIVDAGKIKTEASDKDKWKDSILYKRFLNKTDNWNPDHWNMDTNSTIPVYYLNENLNEYLNKNTGDFKLINNLIEEIGAARFKIGYSYQRGSLPGCLVLFKTDSKKIVKSILFTFEKEINKYKYHSIKDLISNDEAKTENNSSNKNAVMTQMFKYTPKNMSKIENLLLSLNGYFSTSDNKSKKIKDILNG